MNTITKDMLALRLKSELPIEKVIENIQEKAAENSFRVLAVHDVKETLAEKGFEREPLSIVEICNSGFAYKALQKDIDVSLFMPCRITVYAEKGSTNLILARPSMIAEMLPGAGLESLAEEVEEVLVKIMKESI